MTGKFETLPVRHDGIALEIDNLNRMRICVYGLYDRS